MRFGLAVALLIAAVAFAAGCGEPDGSGAHRSADVDAGSGNVGPETVRLGRWRVAVRARPSRIGPIEFTIRDLRTAEASDSEPWIQHEVVYHNAGDLPATFADLRGSAFIGERREKRLLAADEGCGYGGGEGSDGPVRPGACRTYLELLRSGPGSSRAKSVTLFKGLTGMEPLRPGTYVDRHPVRFQLGSRAPDRAEARVGSIELVYKIEAAAR